MSKVWALCLYSKIVKLLHTDIDLNPFLVEEIIIIGFHFLFLLKRGVRR